MLIRALWVVLLALATTLPSAYADEADISAFFDQYQRLGKHFNPALANLYSDAASITIKQHQPNGTIKTITLDGPDYKRLVRVAMPTAERNGDVDVFSDVRIARQGDNYVITAKRYSTLRCYTDPMHKIVVSPNGNSYLIMQEQITSQSYSSCNPK